MKLLDKYNRVSLASTILIFILSAIAFYFALNYTLITQLDEDLKVEQKEIIDNVYENNSLPEAESVGDQQINFIITNKPNTGSKFETVSLLTSKQKRRQLTFSIKAGNKWYKAVVSKSLEGTNNILRAVVFIALSTIALILAATFTAGKKIFKTLWSPFYNSLYAVEKFKIINKQSLQFEDNDIDEFNTMNETLLKTTNKALEDYNSLKQFTENASHELQTPLSIIRSKLEILLQDEQLSETQGIAVQSANEAVSRLARLNQSLLLLTKIENEQYDEKVEVNFKSIAENKINQFKELWFAKHIQSFIQLDDVFVFVNTELLEILLNNLFGNATQHNYDNGKITISLSDRKFFISNSGDTKPLSEQHLFRRFYNPGKNNSSNGLGLAIIKEICEASGFKIHYSFLNEEHCFTIDFN